MIYFRTVIPTLCLLASVAAAQQPAPARAPRPAIAWDDVDVPAPPAAPTPAAAWDVDAPTPPAAPAPPARWQVSPPSPPRPVRAPAAFAPQVAPTPPAPPAPAAVPAPPAPPRYIGDYDFDYHFDLDLEQKLADVQYNLKNLDLDDINERVRTALEGKNFNFNYNFDTQEMNEKIKSMVKDYAQVGKWGAEFGKLGTELGSKFALAPQIRRGGSQSDDRLYSSGQQALDNHHWDEALEAFTLVASRGGTRADGALYWKAHALNKLGRRAEATAAIAELKKTYTSSKWLDDAKALELEIQQSGNRPVNPESQSDEDLKLLALNGLMQSDPDRAIPLVETLLKSSQSLKIRKQAVYVLAGSSSPKAQTLLEAVARGTGANPDLQVSAIRYFGERRKANGGQVLSEVYGSTGDNYVKRAVINAFRSYKDKDRLLAIAKSEKTPELRFEAINALRDIGGAQTDLWQLYQGETTPEGKQQLLDMIPSAGNTDKIVEVAKTEKDPKVRRQAIQKLGNERNAAAGDALVSIYTSESDQDVKRSIIDALSNQRNAKAMIAAAKAEKDVRMQQRIVERLPKSPETTEYLMELLKK